MESNGLPKGMYLLYLIITVYNVSHVHFRFERAFRDRRGGRFGAACCSNTKGHSAPRMGLRCRA